ncbi:MAG: hypothetical protein OXE77_10515 [Flavobacteriaceae bacterium]|nr:hypothetical protein [Flavobacteriaceae bacterium]
MKAIVAIDAIQERGTLKEMSVHYDVSQAMISKWKCIGLIARMV